MAIDYTKKINALNEKEEKLNVRRKRVQAERKRANAKFDKALRSAETEAAFVLGRMMLRQFPDFRGINWEKLERYLTRDKTIQWHVERFYNADFDAGKPYENLNKFKENSNYDY